MRYLLAVLALVVLVAPARTRAQGSPLELHAGAGLYPGTGGIVVAARPFFSAVTTEGALYADYQPRVLGGRGRLLIAAGAGGSLRLLRMLSIARGSEIFPDAEIDVGARLGPAFYYAFFEQTAEEEARSFRVMLDPFARAVLPFRGRRAFAELGTQAPQLRAGLVF